MSLYARYLKAMTIACLAMLLAIGGLNYAIDPYGYFGVPRIDGLSTVKPAAATRARIIKPMAAKRSQARGWVIGNSRPELGLDPDSPNWKQAARPLFNFAMPGANVSTQGKTAKFALSEATTKYIYWGLDLVDFLASSEAHQVCDRGDQIAHAVGGPDPFAWQLTDALLAIWSTRAVVDSLWTMTAQHRPDSANRTDLGFNPANDFWFPIKGEGQPVLFKLKNDEMRRRLVDKDLVAFKPGCEWSAEFAVIDEVLVQAKVRSVEVVLFINPYHRDYLSIMREAGLWERMLEWKHRLARLARQHGVELFDFSGHGPGIDDEVSGLKKGEALAWYWEPAHYRKELGELMIARMTGKSSGAAGAIGTKLAP